MTAERQALAARLRREFWNAVCEWERHSQHNTKHTMQELSAAYDRAQAASDAVHAALTDDTDRRLLGEIVKHSMECKGSAYHCGEHGYPRPCPHERAKARLVSATDEGDKTAKAEAAPPNQQQEPALKEEGSTGALERSV